ncbi:hypothetical protein COCVIDRAFT_101257, partial [Bipolaris victoriae FI3]
KRLLFSLAFVPGHAARVLHTKDSTSLYQAQRSMFDRQILSRTLPGCSTETGVVIPGGLRRMLIFTRRHASAHA